MSYWFAVFAATFFIFYYCFPVATARRYLILLSGLVFQVHFAGPAGVLPIAILGAITYIAGRSSNRWFIKGAVVVCVLALFFYKYTIFFTAELIGVISPELAAQAVVALKTTVLPAAPPMAISFFVFEFVHYLVDVLRGEKPIKSITDFGLFALYWPTMVAGPIKRYEHFIPSVRLGCGRVAAEDVMMGMVRVAVGICKKFIADNLTLMIDYWVPQFDTAPTRVQWMIFFAIGLRILLDFSGYSDMAIGFARMSGIKIPENFNWPYLATGPIDFWRRWHMSLSTWIRDYVYIPLGGSRSGMVRKIVNGLVAFALCGLWHGAGWNFIVWGLYHGVGLAVNTLWRAINIKIDLPFKRLNTLISSTLSRVATLMFVMVGWLYFFYPVSKATHMLMRLIGLES